MEALRLLIVGAGFSGAVLARELAERLNARIVVIDSRAHCGGNCHTERDKLTGIMLHVYGPHIFHTNSALVWDYISRFTQMRPFVNRVKAIANGSVYSLPINLHTINQFFGNSFNPLQARDYIERIADTTVAKPRNFEEHAVQSLGWELYRTFLYGYTRKQWGCEPQELPVNVLKRLPIRFNYDDNYYNHQFQGIPETGYTGVIDGLLAHPRIELRLSTEFREGECRDVFHHVFYTGPIDSFFNYRFGRLRYRSIRFERIDAHGDYQGNAVINYSDVSVPWTRIHEHKHFTPWESHENTVAFKEYSFATMPGDVPYYPLRLQTDLDLLSEYVHCARSRGDVTFFGRLGSYRYLDMDQVIAESLALADPTVDALSRGARLPVVVG